MTRQITPSECWESNYDKVLRDALALSSGTIASLINDNRHATIERVQSDFALFVAARGPNFFRTWHEAWKAFRAGD